MNRKSIFIFKWLVTVQTGETESESWPVTPQLLRDTIFRKQLNFRLRRAFWFDDNNLLTTYSEYRCKLYSHKLDKTTWAKYLSIKSPSGRQVSKSNQRGSDHNSLDVQLGFRFLFIVTIVNKEHTQEGLGATINYTPPSLSIRVRLGM